MRILITTGIYPPEIGGPAQYAKNLKENFEVLNHQVKVKTYGWERRLPSGFRHFYFFLKIIPALLWCDFCISLDTFSVGYPSVLAGKILRKKIIIRTGGDFLWEQYVERTEKKVLLRNFYPHTFPSIVPTKSELAKRYWRKGVGVYKTETNNFSFKEKIIFKLTKWTLKNSNVLVFSTEWQKGIWQTPYNLDNSKTFIIENFYGDKLPADSPAGKIFIGVARKLKWKNFDTLETAFALAKDKNKELLLDLENCPYHEFLDKLKSCYAVILVSLGDISPNFILDAIRFNKPFILTRECGLYDRVKNIGIFVDPLNKGEIKEKIIFLSKPENYEAQKKKVENFSFTHSWQEIAQEFIDVLNK